MIVLWKGGTIGPWEPEDFRAIRNQYWARRLLLDRLESRITRTPAGFDWLMRVKRIGRNGT